MLRLDGSRVRGGLARSIELEIEFERTEEYFFAAVELVDRWRSWLTSEGSMPSFSAAS